MRFCKDCGTPLNLFGSREKDLCSACIQNKSKAEVVVEKKTTKDCDEFQLLGDATLSAENGKIVLRSKEGWELWSGTQNQSIEVKTLLSRAQRIYQIRLRRQKN